MTVNDSKPAGDLTEYIGRLEGLEIEYRLGQGAMELVEGKDSRVLSRIRRRAFLAPGKRARD